LTDRTNCWIVRALEVSMRPWLLAVVVAAAGCAAQGLPVESGGPGPSSPSGGGNNGGVNVSVPDMARPLGGPGEMCQSACDCMPGLACPNGTCGKSMFGPIYCCESSDCPGNSFCQSANGGFGTCNTSGGGGNPGGPPFFGDMTTMPEDAGAGSLCRQVKCSADSECTAAGCTMCTRRGTCR
jgi:hypothetical protein